MEIQDCPKCSGTMYQESILVDSTTNINLDESYEDMWVCEDCGEQLELTNDYEN